MDSNSPDHIFFNNIPNTSAIAPMIEEMNTEHKRVRNENSDRFEKCVILCIIVSDLSFPEDFWY
jgi:hypothetical protein